MKILFQLAVLTLAASICVQAQEISLFNGRDLSGWDGLPEYWTVRDGAITGTVTDANKSKGNTFLIWRGEVADFELSFQFKLTAENQDGMANSGVQFRAQMMNQARHGIKGYQVELDPGTLHPKNWNIAGNVSGVVTDDPPGELLGTIGNKSLYKPGDWNECRVIAVGNHIRTFINGLPAADAVDSKSRYARGLLGFQLHNPMQLKTIQFKEIRLLVIKHGFSPAGLTTTNPIAPAPLAIIQSDPTQSRIQVIKEQGPNSSEWALTPLDEAIPTDIRQNLTFLREDLLDEGKNTPKASVEAYKLAAEYCDKLLAALDQRNAARVNAGFRAAQADANKDFSNQALNARRNYKMRWPQYAREESQRAALRENETDKADVKKERVKVEWAERARQMRVHLDEVYRKLREAMR